MISAILIISFVSVNPVGLPPSMPVEYTLEVRLDTTANMIYGEERIRFQNPTGEPLEQLCFHLYPNAFRDTTTVFCREDRRVRSDVAAGNVSRLDVSDVELNGSAVDSSQIRVAGTLMSIDLRDKLPPGRRIDVSLRFQLLIPQINVRFGRDRDGNYLLSHWYPILCGYQKGRLIDNEYHANSEFYSNFGNYNVRLLLPPEFIVGSTGHLVRLEDSGGLAVWQVRADSVIDYAFACGPSFEVRESDTLGIGIHYLLKADGSAGKDRLQSLEKIDKITRYTLAYCSEKLFPYPYSDFTVVEIDPGAGGLELPGLVAVDFSAPAPMRSSSWVDATLAHETIHQWFYAAIATNEAEEPWLDEGLTSYLTSRIIGAYTRNEGFIRVFGYNISLDEIFRFLTLMRKAPYPVDLKSWEYPDQLEYNSAVYSRAQLVLKTVERVSGDSVFMEALKEYARRYRFGHPDGDDFLTSIESSTDIDLTEFFSQFVAGTARVDYAIKSLEYEKVDRDSGDTAEEYRISVGARRELDGIVPQRITVVCESGARLDTLWDGRSRLVTFEFSSAARPAYAALDDGGIVELDENRTNNRIYAGSHWTRLVSFEWDAVFAIELLLSLFL